MKKLIIGILAHVDAGKTTLSESMLYLSGSIRKLGRVDHKDTFLDTYELERARGITIFSKQAEFTFKNMEVTLLDTPGHVDFSAEMERTLQVLDYAILVISGTDGVQGHTQTLWKLLKTYHIPTFLFVNKMDIGEISRDAIIEELKTRLGDGCFDFDKEQDNEVLMEGLAMYDEAVLEHYLETGKVEKQEIAQMIAQRKIFPCYFGSALKLDGVEAFLECVELYTKQPEFLGKFGAKIFKITRDEQDNRLTYMKITGGSIKVKDLLTNQFEKNRNGKQIDRASIWEEKADQIRIYSGTRYETIDEAKAGTICAITGLSKTFSGEGLGTEATSSMPILEPVLTYRIILPPECDVHGTLLKLRELEEEEPNLNIVWNERLKEIHVQLMGEVQSEILKSLIQDRFDLQVEFGEGNIVYKETISEAVEGVGHFEPLRHYAEVHLVLEPGEQGSGMQFSSSCSEDMLDRNWQRLVLTHLEEKEHFGVLTGSPITDMKITLVAGRAHQKHTEGGDFRQATYRAIRQGLKKTNSVLLEPYYSYRLEIPSVSVGRAMSDIQKMYGTFLPLEIEGESSILEGYAPVATMWNYSSEVTAYTKGEGRLFCTLKGYEPCHNTEEVLDLIQYDSENDLENPTGSVFCTHGAGFIVSWDKVQDYMHLDSVLKTKEPEVEQPEQKVMTRTQPSSLDSWQNDKELEAIFTRTFGPIKRKLSNSYQSLGHEKTIAAPGSSNDKSNKKVAEKEKAKDYLLVDGYNIIFDWDELKELAKINLEAARNKLMDILCNYQGFKQCILILIFDAYKVKGNIGDTLNYNNIHVVYTKEAETADMYIEKVTFDIGRKHNVMVATSDALEQIIIMGHGASRISANGLKEEIEQMNQLIRRDYLDKLPKGRNYLSEKLVKLEEKFES
ncbi:MAG: NYN domain-containing protein [Lachnotalea sp.]